jgi:hypothetical protein
VLVKAALFLTVCAVAALDGRARTLPNKIQAKPNKTTKIAWFYLVLFVRIGTFQRVSEGAGSIRPVEKCIGSRKEIVGFCSAGC